VQSGFPSASVFIFDIAIDGKALPVSGRSSLHSASVIYSQVWVSSWRPRYSSRYDWSQMALSFGDSL